MLCPMTRGGFHEELRLVLSRVGRVTRPSLGLAIRLLYLLGLVLSYDLTG